MGMITEYLTNSGRNYYRHLDKGEDARLGEFRCVYQWEHESGLKGERRIATLQWFDAIELINTWNGKSKIWQYKLISVERV